jgi:hypothetical protein
VSRALPNPQPSPGLPGLEQDVSVLKMNSSDNSRKCGCHPFHDPVDCRISAKITAEALTISRERAGYIIMRF